MQRIPVCIVVVALFSVFGLAGPLHSQETIDFEGLPAGTIVSAVFGDMGSGPIAVDGFKPPDLGVNAAVIFDSANPTGGDVDLGTPNTDFGGPGVDADGDPNTGGNAGSPFQNDTALGNLLIVAEDLVDTDMDGLVDDPDDADVLGAQMSFDFSALGTVTVFGITLIDVEADEPAANVQLFDATDTDIGFFVLPAVGDNGVTDFDLGPTSGVARMVVVLNGSGAVDNITFLMDEEEDGEGCTPGYWKNHLDDWVGFAPEELIGDVFVEAGLFPDLAASTLLEGLRFKGGPEAVGGARILLRAAVASLLNAAHPDVAFARTVGEVIDAVNAALATGDRQTMLSLKDELDEENNAGCPLGAMFSDEFEAADGPDGWSVQRGTWVQQGGTWTGLPDAEVGTKIKARAVADTAFEGCGRCVIEAGLSVVDGSGRPAEIHARLIGWYQDKGTNVSVTLKPAQGKVVFQQKQGKVTLLRESFDLLLVEGRTYAVQVRFNRGVFRVFIDGVNVFDVASAATSEPQGTIALQSRNAAVAVERVAVP